MPCPVGQNGTLFIPVSSSHQSGVRTGLGFLLSGTGLHLTHFQAEWGVTELRTLDAERWPNVGE